MDYYLFIGFMEASKWILPSALFPIVSGILIFVFVLFIRNRDINGRDEYGKLIAKYSFFCVLIANIDIVLYVLTFCFAIKCKMDHSDFHRYLNYLWQLSLYIFPVYLLFLFRFGIKSIKMGIKIPQNQYGKKSKNLSIITGVLCIIFSILLLWPSILLILIPRQ